MRKFEVVTGFEGVVVIPTRATKGSAGYDIHICRNYDTYIKPGEVVMFDTGIKAQFPEDEVLMLFIRSSLGFKKGLILSNAVPIIDSDYYNNEDNEGHITLSITNVGNETQVIPPNARVAQGVFLKYYKTDDDNVEASRRGGVGSTGE